MKLSGKPIIFDYFPDLHKHVDWLDLKLKMAPVQKIAALGHDNLWIKRNDLISDVYGGNKVGRLEFILADVIKKKKTHVVTLGGIGSNHCLAVAIFSRQLGIRCTLSLFEQPLTNFVKENLLLYHYFGAEIRFFPGILRSAFDFYYAQKRKHPDAYFLESGGASVLGTLGAVNSALELKQQVEAGEIPEPDYVFYPTASNCGMAGLSLGFLLAEMKTTVIGVRTGRSRLGPFALNTPGTVLKKIQQIYQFLKSNSKMVKTLDIPTPVLINEYCGRGYGFPSPEGEKAIHLFKKLNIRLEPVYTAKTCAALLDNLKITPYSSKTLLYWHTYNPIDYSAIASTIDYKELPTDLHYCFQ
ncbi:pyridoxal-phosphate dependent enzyme [bacterium]|nr:pyridoxal-phosphate dependent enzyme [bacterium]